MISITGLLLLVLGVAGVAAQASAAGSEFRREAGNAIPRYPYDANTTRRCTWWYDSDGSLGCEDLDTVYGVSLVDFLQWNPSVPQTCGKLATETSFCIGALPVPHTRVSRTSAVETSTPIPSTTTISVTVSVTTLGVPLPPITKTISVTITDEAITSVVTSVVTLPPRPSPSSTRPSNGVTTPTPYQDGMINQCSTFYLTKRGDTCGGISAANGISLQDFVSWNPGVGGTSCATLWADTYVCVNLIGRAPTKTKVGNGVHTPEPIQPGMSDRCKNFYFVSQGDSCEGIASKFSISPDQLTRWNPSARSDCTGLWAGTYCCVGVL